MQTYSILALCLSLGYVAAQDSECAEYVRVAHATVLSLSGHYQRDSTLPYPQYYMPFSTGMNTISYEDGYVNFAHEEGYLIHLTTTPSYKTCFPKYLNQRFNVSGPYAAQVGGYVILTAYSSTPFPFEEDYIKPTSLPNQCAECKQVLDGPLQNLYELVSEYDPRCEDECLYSNPEGREFCFEAGPDQVLLECPPGPGPIQTTIPN